MAGTLQFGHAQDDLHRHLRGLAMLAVEQCLVVFGEFDRGGDIGARQRAVECLPGIARQVFEHGHR
ncbi:hypothetical protein D3C85_1690010 [compost metagenome]